MRNNRTLRSIYEDYRADPAFGGLRQHARFVPGSGDHEQPPIMFIGEAPGANEDRVGRPFVGRSGTLLDELLASIELGREQVFITNVVKYRPPGNRTPDRFEIEYSRPYLRREVRTVRPEVIVPLGAVALKLVQPNSGSIHAVHGTILASGPWKIFPTFHPAYALRSKRVLRLLEEDFRKLVLVAEL